MTSDMQNSSQAQTPSHEADETTKGGLPMRGLAMILIAVAVLLAAWALWSMTGSDDSNGGSNNAATSTEQSQATESAPGTLDNSEADQQDAQASDPATTNGAPNPAEGTAAPQESGAPAPAGGGSSVPVTTLHVLNNSTVPQLAARVADELDRDYDTVESGNLADVVIPENTVYFTPGNTEAENAARELADRVGGIAMERTDVLPSETEGKDAIVLVLVQDVAL